jgi:hypothetical protein
LVGFLDNILFSSHRRRTSSSSGGPVAVAAVEWPLAGCAVHQWQSNRRFRGVSCCYAAAVHTAALALSKAEQPLENSPNSPAAGRSTSSGGGGGAEAAGEAVSEAVNQPRELGLQLTSVPIPYACNNPNCGNVAGLSEQQLVGGRSC